MILVICNVFFDCLSSDKFTASQHLVLALHELHGTGLLEMSGHFLSRNATTATSRAVKGKVLTDCEVGCSNIPVGALELAVRAMVVAQGTIFVKVAKKMLALHFVATPFRAIDLLKDACAFCVSLSISQVTLPHASPPRIGACHLETSQSSPVEMVLSCGEVFTIDGALFNVFDAVPTEQVPTTGLHWVRD